MAKAWKAPTPNRQCRYYISQHAIERFRERVEEDFRSRSDRDLALLLDERIAIAVDAGIVDDVIDADAPDVTTKVVRIELRTGSYLYAVMRTHRPSSYPPLKTLVGPNGIALAAVTVLTQEMATRAFSMGRWKSAPELNRKVSNAQLGNRPFAEKLANVTPVAPAPAPAPTPTPAPAATAQPETKPEPKPERTLGGSRAQRSAFAMNYIRENPVATRSEISAAVEEKFGTPMSSTLIDDLRACVLPPPAPTTVAPAPIAAPAPVPASAPASVAIAIQYGQAVESERVARARVEAAQRELEAAHAILAGATSQVELLLAQMQAQRSA